MDWAIHHVNLISHDLEQSSRFYRDIIGLSDGAGVKTGGDGTGKFDRNRTIYLGDGNRGLHIMLPMPALARDNGLSVNPALHGHTAINVPDISEVKARLDKAGIMYADAGNYSMPNLYQIYLYDPFMNCIEINQEL